MYENEVITMKCKVCDNRLRKKSVKNIRFKSGCMCVSCYNTLPNVIKNNIDRISVDEVVKIKKILTEHKTPTFAKCGSFYMCENAVQVNEWEIKLKDIRKIYLSFHPKTAGHRKNMAYGKMGIVIETVKPHIIMEDILWDEELEYKISGEFIDYVFPKNILNMINRIQKAIDDKTYSLKAYKEEMRREKEERERKERRNKDTKENVSKAFIDLKVAERLYGVEIPYTLDTIKAIKTNLIKKMHPDQGGSTELCALINSSFDILKKYAAS